MSEKHTPGPWKVTGKGPYREIVAAKDDAPIGYRTYGGDSEAQANAHLIATAPELLTALKGIRFLVPHGLNWLDERGSDREHARGEAALVALDAAIAKAEGRQP
jgi:hypothetical protein